MARDYWFAFGPQPSATASLSPTFITFVGTGGQTLTPPSIAENFPGSGLYRVNYTASQTIAFVMDGATTGLSTSNRYIFGVMDPQDTMGQTLIGFANTSIAIGLSSIALGNSNIALGNTNVALGITLTGVGRTGAAFGATGAGQGFTNTLFLQALSATLIAQGQTLVAFGLTQTAGGATVVAMGNTLLAQGQTLVAFGNTQLAQSVTLVAIGNTLAAFGTSYGAQINGIGSTGSTFGGQGVDPDSVFGYLKRVVNFLEGDQTYLKATGNLTYKSIGSSNLLATKTIADTISSTTRS